MWSKGILPRAAQDAVRIQHEHAVAVVRAAETQIRKHLFVARRA